MCVLPQLTYRAQEDHYNYFLSPVFTAAASYGQKTDVENAEIVVWPVRLTWVVSESALSLQKALSIHELAPICRDI